MSEPDRGQVLHDLEGWLEVPMALLGLIWLGILTLEVTRGIGRTLTLVSVAIWAVFVFDFLLRLALAPNRAAYLRTNWLTLLSLVVPALRIARFVRVFRAVRVVQGFRLVRVVTSINRGVGSVAEFLKGRGAAYVFAMTIVVVFGGAAGILMFERSSPGFATYGDALWFTAMLVTTLGSGSWPNTTEGRVLTVLLSCYSLGVLGYVTAALASFFVGRDAAAKSQQGVGPIL